MASNAHDFLIEYKYSACIKIITQDLTILCDPWFSDCAYYGAWSPSPRHRITENFLGDFDYIWLSHIHPDHYCKHTINEIFKLYGEKTILIADWDGNKNYLKFKLLSDGFSEFVQEVSQFTVGKTCIKCIPDLNGSASDIDSCLIVHDSVTRKGILNFNDCLVSDSLVKRINSYLEFESISLELFCLGYTGAGPYPQTYYSPISDEPILKKIAESKKKFFLDKYLTAISLIASRYRLPFAGKYLLSGDLAFMNKYRGVADALEVKLIDPMAIILDDSGLSSYNIMTGDIGNQRDTFYEDQHVNMAQPLWKQWINFVPENSILERLLRNAYKSAFLKSECRQDYIWNFYVYDSDIILEDLAEHPFEFSQFILGFNCNSLNNPFIYLNPQLSSEVTSSLFIDRRALFAALTGICHWNNLEVGSGFFVRREPDVFIREAQKFLNFLSVI